VFKLDSPSKSIINPVELIKQVQQHTVLEVLKKLKAKMKNGDVLGTNVLSQNCACPSLTDSSLPCLLAGVVIGILVTKYVPLPSRYKRKSESTKENEISSQEDTSQTRKGDVAGLDAELEVLNAAIPLFENKFSMQERDFTLNEKDGKTKLIVNYLEPEEMIKTLFFEQSDEKDTKSDLTSDQSMSLTHPLGDTNKKENMIHLLKQIQKYSVCTDHPYFYNQLFGALDPIGTAAELVALSVHTSAYTYETAPVFTLMERHVLEKLAELVYDTKAHDGLFLPGGSLSNLTGMHVARHVCKARGTFDKHQDANDGYFSNEPEEEKKESMNDLSNALAPRNTQLTQVAFVSSEAHYSFKKAAGVLGIDAKDIVTVPTLSNGQMDAEELDLLMTDLVETGTKVPFFVGLTAGSTVRGSFDDIGAVVRVCRKHEAHLNNSMPLTTRTAQKDSTESGHKIWVHVDGAWGGCAVFSPRKDLCKVMEGVRKADSFTFNPHKVMGAPQQTTCFVTRHKVNCVLPNH